MKILTLGGATQDIFIQHEAIESIELIHHDTKKSFLLLQEGAKTEIDSLYYASGGGATNTAVALSRLGWSVTCVCKIGNDEAGQYVLSELKQEGIITDFCSFDTQKRTGTSYIIPSENAERTVLTYRGANMFLAVHDIPYNQFNHYSYIYISSLSGSSSQHLVSITQSACQQGCTVVVNPGINQLKQESDTFFKSLPYIDIVIFNKKEAEQCMRLLCMYLSPVKIQSTTLEIPSSSVLLKDLVCINQQMITFHNFFEILSQKGPRTIVVTNGKDGVYVYHDKVIYFHPSLNVDCISTLGAGDAFGAAFVAGLGSKRSIEVAIRMGIVNSTSVIQYLDAKNGLLYSDSLEQLIEMINPHLLEKYTL